jgi:glycosyltransferase involved in cell wall biosynthesis
MVELSVVTPFLNEQGNLPLFRERLLVALEKLDASWELVLVDDHSDDDSPRFAKEWAALDPRVRYLRLSRTSGSHAAWSAGLASSRGTAVIMMAADLQDPPEAIGRLLAEWRQGYHVVWASRADRQGESWLTKAFSACYYRAMRKLALPNMPRKGADFLLMDRRVVDAYNSIPEKNTSFFGIILWLGFRQTCIEYVKQPRHAGKSKWTLSKKIKLFIDSLVSFSYAPIRLMSVLGVVVSVLGMLYACFVVVHALQGRAVEGWSSLIVVALVLGGFQLLMLGILGEYLWRTYDESRGRPRYLIEEEFSRKDRSDSPSKAA